MSHIAPPRVCQKCRTETEQESRAVKGLRYAATFCRHRGAHAIVVIQNGTIISWTISNCDSIEEALRKSRAVYDQELDDMLPDPSPPTTLQ